MEPCRLWEGGPLFYPAEHAPLTTDTVLLAGFTRVSGGDEGADLGCASGGILLPLLWQHPSLRMTGIELVPEAAALAEENLRLNALAERGRILNADLREAARALPAGGFDFVVSNPPYFEQGSGKSPPDPQRAAAREEAACTLPELCWAASRLCRSGGRVFFSCRPERLRQLMAAMADCRLEPKRLRFVHHSREHAAFLLLCEGRKDGRPGLEVEPPLFLRGESGEETEEYLRFCHR